MRVLCICSVSGYYRGDLPHRICFKSGVDDRLRAELERWGTRDFVGKYERSASGSQWWFEFEEDRTRFINHRLMIDWKTLRLVPRIYGQDAENFFPENRVIIKSRPTFEDIRGMVSEDLQDFYWYLMEEWVYANCRSLFAITYASGGGILLKDHRYEFEDPAEAEAFRQRWTR